MPHITHETLEHREFIRANCANMTDSEIGEKLGITRSAVKSCRQRMKLIKVSLAGNRSKLVQPIPKSMGLPNEIEKKLEEHTTLKDLFDTMGRVERGVKVHKIAPLKLGDGETEAVAVWVASDWHIEEQVKSEWVNGLNAHNLDVSAQRSEEYFKNGLRLTQIFGRDVKINRVCLALLGDFITNDIHEEMREINQLQPMDAILRAQEYIASGIKYILDNSNYAIDIVCASGNHGRTTDENYYSTESGHSLEHFMYRSLATFYQNEPRVKFTINNSYHTIVDVLGYKIRFHHGHRIKYGGGVGGLYIPVNKKISIWNNAIAVNLDVFGHFHTFRDGGSFVSNGSQIGYNAYALGNGLPFERPQQALFIVDEKRGKTITAPILYSV